VRRKILFTIAGLGAALLVCSVAAAEASPQTPVQRSPNPPAWTKASSDCGVDLTDVTHPSGVVGYIGYNVYDLAIVEHRHVSCREAKRLARAEWVHGPLRRPLSWHYRRAWRSTSGSAYVGDFVGTHGRRRVEFFAGH
jgi:hypothetical protein